MRAWRVGVRKKTYSILRAKFINVLATRAMTKKVLQLPGNRDWLRGDPKI